MDLRVAAARVAGLLQPLQDRPDYGSRRPDEVPEEDSEDTEDSGDLLIAESPTC